MSISNFKKTIDTSVMYCNSTATVTISFDAAAALAQTPSDMILIMDRSGSMDGEKLRSAKEAAKQLIRTVTIASGGTEETIANNNRMGIVSFSDHATQDIQLTNDTTALYDVIDKLRSGDLTNHRAAFEAAEQMMPPKGTKRQIVVMFTDGATTTGGDPAPIAQRMKAAGIEIFCIGLLSNPATLNLWASDPDTDYVAYTDDTNQLNRVFQSIAAGVILAGARGVEIHEKVTPDFKIVKINAPAKGTAQITGAQTLLWKINAVGLAPEPETASLTFEIMHIGAEGGMKPVNQSLDYQDLAGNQPVFPCPMVTVYCEPMAYPEPCPIPYSFQAESCQDTVQVKLPAIEMQSLGRIVQVSATVQNVCPNKRVAMAIMLIEEDDDGVEYARGTKTILIPAQQGDHCQDVTVRCIQFVVPEVMDPTATPYTICDNRKFKVRAIANYVDTDYVCCDVATTLV